MRVVELFAGIGGLGLGVSGAGFKSEAVIEWDRDCVETLRANAARGHELIKHWPVFHGDVRNFNFNTVKSEIDLVCGGPPCQPFSIGGKHKGPDDPRDMWSQAIRAVGELRPSAFIFENVRGLTRAAFADYLRYITARLRHPTVAICAREGWQDHLERLEKIKKSSDDLTYKVNVQKVNAADYGAAQKRHRVVIVGIRQDLGVEWQFPAPTHSREALAWSKFVTGDYWRRHGIKTKDRPKQSAADARMARALADRLVAPELLPWVTVRDTISNLPPPQDGGHLLIPNHRFQAGAKVYAGHTGSPLDEPAKALKAGDHGVPGGENMLARPDGSVRYFTVRESARLQGFPDSYVFPSSWTESMRQLGNAVPVKLAQVVAQSILSLLEAANRGVRLQPARQEESCGQHSQGVTRH